METISISAFKAKISEQLRKVRGGESMIIADRDTPIALVSPVGSMAELELRRPRSRRFAPPPSPPRIGHDPLDHLLAERSSR
jgi:antitoxin (DNA-binding transcriptional repressor) of toxin-antitoxin stability system